MTKSDYCVVVLLVWNIVCLVTTHGFGTYVLYTNFNKPNIVMYLCLAMLSLSHEGTCACGIYELWHTHRPPNSKLLFYARYLLLLCTVCTVVFVNVVVADGFYSTAHVWLLYWLYILCGNMFILWSLICFIYFTFGNADREH
jgi:hypothetical protein